MNAHSSQCVIECCDPSLLYKVLVPSLEELQAAVNQVVGIVRDIGQSIPSWSPISQQPSLTG